MSLGHAAGLAGVRVASVEGAGASAPGDPNGSRDDGGSGRGTDRLSDSQPNAIKPASNHQRDTAQACLR
ncbi:MAG: hypothetical protein AB7K71_08645 [Polyangiaceae bacterium]